MGDYISLLEHFSPQEFYEYGHTYIWKSRLYPASNFLRFQFITFSARLYAIIGQSRFRWSVKKLRFHCPISGQCSSHVRCAFWYVQHSPHVTYNICRPWQSMKLQIRLASEATHLLEIFYYYSSLNTLRRKHVCQIKIACRPFY